MQKEQLFPIFHTLINNKNSFLKKDYHLLEKGNVDFVSFSLFTFVELCSLTRET